VKYLVAVLLAVTVAMGDMMEVERYIVDIHSKKGDIQKVEISMVVDGYDVLDESHKFYDALGIVISSFYIEDLFTSKGKERFKKALVRYLHDKYTIRVDEIFLQRLILVKDVEIRRLLEVIREEGICKE
jgi:hypothetical protein